MSREPHSEAAALWLAEHSADVAVSTWALAETSNVLARRARIKELTAAQHARAVAGVRQLCQSFEQVALGDGDVLEAARLVDDWERGLRLADALHLAVARRHQCELVTFDNAMADMARASGVVVTGIGL